MQLGEGLYVMIFGMALVFLTLILLMFAIMGLDRLFRLKVPGDDKEETPIAVPAPAEELTPTATTGYLPGSPRGQVVAAIALAIARAQAYGLPRASWSTRLATPSDGDGASDWIWEEGIEDYGVVEGSQHA